MRISTRRYLASGVAALSLLALSAQAEDYSQAPFFDEAVAAGDLPGVAERLPASPLVFETLGSIGEYGGTMRRAILGGGDQHNMVRTIGHENLVRWSADWTEIKPNIAESFDRV